MEEAGKLDNSLDLSALGYLQTKKELSNSNGTRERLSDNSSLERVYTPRTSLASHAITLTENTL